MRLEKRHPGAYERAAALVEFAILAPLLVFLLFGIVEFGYKFGQFNDVRHAAREAARFAAVDAGNNAAIEAVVCSALEGLGADITRLVLRLDNDTAAAADVPSDGDKGDEGFVAVSVDVSSLTNLPIITVFLPTQLSSSIPFRLEQDSTQWSPQNTNPTPPWAEVTCP